MGVVVKIDIGHVGQNLKLRPFGRNLIQNCQMSRICQMCKIVKWLSKSYPISRKEYLSMRIDLIMVWKSGSFTLIYASTHT
jgi:hypothetical protein